MNPLLLKERLTDVLEVWKRDGLPPRYELENDARELVDWRRAQGIEGLWEQPPLMLTATLDDGLGTGLKIIHSYAEVAGIKIVPLGMFQLPETIIDECSKQLPDLLGLTVLQFSSEDALKQISSNLPAKTQLIVGGSSIFQAEPDLAERAGVHFVAENVAAFLQFLLDLGGVN
ncbi:MAG: hypothetical protein SVM79_06820 [Chloroflexota bacterium]|nr:hypothetical protein [Chloroflexota bacterium]